MDNGGAKVERGYPGSTWGAKSIQSHSTASIIIIIIIRFVKRQNVKRLPWRNDYDSSLFKVTMIKLIIIIIILLLLLLLI